MVRSLISNTIGEETESQRETIFHSRCLVIGMKQAIKGFRNGIHGKQTLSFHILRPIMSPKDAFALVPRDQLPCANGMLPKAFIISLHNVELLSTKTDLIQSRQRQIRHSLGEVQTRTQHSRTRLGFERMRYSHTRLSLGLKCRK
ncbi:hypothetical protein CR513_10304, partial [Mucuna pruriens]